MNGNEFLAVAKRLLQEKHEADWRSAVSRGYYAAFHVGKDFLRGLGFAIPRADSAHAYLGRRLPVVTDQDIAAAGTELNLLRSERNKADYDLDKPFTHAMATQAVSAAEQVVKAMTRLLSETQRARIVQEIRRHESSVLAQSTWHG